MIDKEVKKTIVQELINILEEREYGYTEKALDEIVENSFIKKKSLFELFSKHPNWNPEKLMIQFDADYNRNFNTTAITNFVDYLTTNVLLKNGYPLGYPFATLTKEQETILDFINSIDKQFFDEDMNEAIERVNSLNDNFRLRNNMKSSKAINKICCVMGWDKFETYNQKYAILSDNINPIKVTRHTCISLNPVDFLLMSYGTSWESCHYIGNYGCEAGCYSSGTVSYLLDEHSFVFYTVDSEFNGTDIELEKKLQREIFGYNDEVIFQSRLYPQANDVGAKDVYTDIRNIVQKVIADCLEKPNLWNKTHSDVCEVVNLGEEATCYPDWYKHNPGSSHCSISTLQNRTSTLQRKIIMGAKPICVNCGYPHKVQGTINCCGLDTCVECGCVIYSDDYYTEWEGDVYCENCTTWCSYCDSEVPSKIIEYVKSEDEYICPCCIDRYFSQCDDCGFLFRNENLYTHTNGNKYCDNCVHEYFLHCSNCRDFLPKETLVFNEDTNEYMCKDCYTEYLEQLSEEEENSYEETI